MTIFLNLEAGIVLPGTPAKASLLCLLISLLSFSILKLLMRDIKLLYCGRRSDRGVPDADSPVYGALTSSNRKAELGRGLHDSD